MRAVDLFAGCGGLTSGFEKEDFDIVAAFENWDVAVSCYKRNFNHAIHQVDLSETETAIPMISAYNADIIIGGPPCQDFSHAGKRIEGDRANLTKVYAQIVETIRPRWFVMENVDRAAMSKSFSEARQIFKQSGYGLSEKVLDASYCGVPQKRKRFFCIGLMGAEDGFLDEFLMQKMAKKPMTLRDYFGDSIGFEHYYRHPRNYNRRGIFSIDEPAPTIRGVNRPVPNGYPGHPNDPVPLGDGIRSLTTRERAMIQTFDAEFVLEGSKTDVEQMIGNAVPVKLAQYVAKAIREYNEKRLEVDKVDDMSKLTQWLMDEKKYSRNGAKDVVSRLNRISKFIPLPDKVDDYALFVLEQNESFRQLSVSVKSQLRRAMRLLGEFKTDSI